MQQEDYCFNFLSSSQTFSAALKEYQLYNYKAFRQVLKDQLMLRGSTDDRFARMARGQPVKVITPPNLAKALLDFDGNIDRSCFDANALEKKASQAELHLGASPVSGVKAKAIENLNKLIENGLHIHGGQSPGFGFFYQLLTSTQGLQILATDSQHTLGYFLLKLVGAGSSELQSVLRAMGSSSDLARQMPTVPATLAEKKKQEYLGGLIKLDDSVANLMGKIRDKFQSLATSIVLPGGEHKLYSPPDVVIPAADDVRRLLAPRCPDFLSSAVAIGPFSITGLAVTDSDCKAFASEPLSIIGSASFVCEQKATDLGLAPKSGTLPFSLDRHPACKSELSQGTLERLQTDMAWYAQTENSASQLQLFALCESDLASLSDDRKLSAAKATMMQLKTAMATKYADDLTSFALLHDHALMLANTAKVTDSATLPSSSGAQADVWQCYTDPKSGRPYWINSKTNEATWEMPSGLGSDSSSRSSPGSSERSRLIFSLQQHAGQETRIWFELLVGLLMSERREQVLTELNPFLTEAAARSIFSLVAYALLIASRTAQMSRAIGMVRDMHGLLDKVKGPSLPVTLTQALRLKASTLAAEIRCARHYTLSDSAGRITLDPRFLTFEFISGFLMRKSQVQLIHKFLGAIQTGGDKAALCHQMIMGAGKTTMIAPLLNLVLADGDTLVVQVVPSALLNFSRSVMRERFSAIFNKPIYTFQFSRQTRITGAIVTKLKHARDTKAVLIASPTSVKSFAIKFVELLSEVDEYESRRAEGKDQRRRRGFWASLIGGAMSDTEPDPRPILLQQASACSNAIQLLKEGILLLDEVDLILHPFKSELNWPLGEKEPLDFSVSKLGPGLRWRLPFHLLDAIFAFTHGSLVNSFEDSREAKDILDELHAKMKAGAQAGLLQMNPHLVLLDRRFYVKEMLPRLARWLFIWMRINGLKDVSDTMVPALSLRFSPSRFRMTCAHTRV